MENQNWFLLNCLCSLVLRKTQPGAEPLLISWLRYNRLPKGKWGHITTKHIWIDLACTNWDFDPSKGLDLYWGLLMAPYPSYLHIQRIKFKGDRKSSALRDLCMARHLCFLQSHALLVPNSNQLERTQTHTNMITGVIVLGRWPLPCRRVLFSVRVYQSRRTFNLFIEPFGLTEPQELWRSISNHYHTWPSSGSVCVMLTIQHHTLHCLVAYYYVHNVCVPNMLCTLLFMSTSKSKQHEQCQRFIQGVYKESR